MENGVADIFSAARTCCRGRPRGAPAPPVPPIVYPVTGAGSCQPVLIEQWAAEREREGVAKAILLILCVFLESPDWTA